MCAYSVSYMQSAVIDVSSNNTKRRFRHPEFARLGIGPFIDELLQAVDARVMGSSPHHLLLYAGHDSTIVPILAALGIYNDMCVLLSFFLST